MARRSQARECAPSRASHLPEAAELREDLFYRLHVFPIRVPALRERGRDVACWRSASSRT
jgi:transcriptional regulator of aromatic amino acid metabolism